MEIPAGVGVTAVFTAYARAVESRRPDRLFTDPLAEHFAARGERALAALAASANSDDIWRFMGGYFAIRTRFFDEYLLQACERGCRQVVLLAAGLDTRAFRITWPAGTRLFEVDTPDVLGFKEEILTDSCSAPACDRVAVAADLRGPWRAALVDAGFCPSAPTAWLAEGILIYLDDAACERLLADVRDLSAPGSHVAISRTGAGRREWAQRRAALAAIDESAGVALGGMWRNGASRIDLPSLLARHGWAATVHDIADLAAAYGRRPAPAFDPGAADARAGFVTACLDPSSDGARADLGSLRQWA